MWSTKKVLVIEGEEVEMDSFTPEGIINEAKRRGLNTFRVLTPEGVELSPSDDLDRYDRLVVPSYFKAA